MGRKAPRMGFPSRCLPSSAQHRAISQAATPELHPQWNLVLKLQAGTSGFRALYPPCSSLYVMVRAWESTQILMETLREKRGKQPGARGGDTTYKGQTTAREAIAAGQGHTGVSNTEGLHSSPGRARQGRTGPHGHTEGGSLVTTGLRAPPTLPKVLGDISERITRNSKANGICDPLH